MKDKDLPLDNDQFTLEELTDQANNCRGIRKWERPQ